METQKKVIEIQISSLENLLIFQQFRKIRILILLKNKSYKECNQFNFHYLKFPLRPLNLLGQKKEAKLEL